MDILIKGMEMPKEVNHPLFIRILSDGHIEKGDFLKGGFIETDAKAIEVPPHGRLIDENDLVRLIEDDYGCGVCKNKADEERCLDRCKWAVLLNDIDSLPTVLEASK